MLMDATPVVVLLIWYFNYVIRGGPYPQVPVWFFLKKKKSQVKSPSPESRVPETGSDPLIGSDRDSGRDNSSILLEHCSFPIDLLCS